MLALQETARCRFPPILPRRFSVPFFFGGASWALIALTLWICSLTGEITLPTALDPLAWHRHEMLFGFVGAVIGGFLLTAVPNWTGAFQSRAGRLRGCFRSGSPRGSPCSSRPISGFGPPSFSTSASSWSWAWSPRAKSSQTNRNLPVVGMILLFGLADALDYLCTAEPSPCPTLDGSSPFPSSSCSSR